MSELSLKDVMRTFPQGVTVVTAEGDDGPRGITVSSFTSVSLAPPLVLICILKEARAHDAINKGRFVVNVLAEGQGTVSDHFASPKLSSDEQFHGYGFPQLEGWSRLPALQGRRSELTRNAHRVLRRSGQGRARGRLGLGRIQASGVLLAPVLGLGRDRS